MTRRSTRDLDTVAAVTTTSTKSSTSSTSTRPARRARGESTVRNFFDDDVKLKTIDSLSRLLRVEDMDATEPLIWHFMPFYYRYWFNIRSFVLYAYVQ